MRITDSCVPPPDSSHCCRNPAVAPSPEHRISAGEASHEVSNIFCLLVWGRGDIGSFSERLAAETRLSINPLVVVVPLNECCRHVVHVPIDFRQGGPLYTASIPTHPPSFPCIPPPLPPTQATNAALEILVSTVRHSEVHGVIVTLHTALMPPPTPRATYYNCSSRKSCQHRSKLEVQGLIVTPRLIKETPTWKSWTHTLRSTGLTRLWLTTSLKSHAPTSKLPLPYPKHVLAIPVEQNRTAQCHPSLCTPP